MGRDAHADHVDPEGIATLTAENPQIRIFAETGAVSALREAGVSATALHPEDKVLMGEDEIAGVGGTHAGIHEDLGESGNVGIVLRTNGHPPGLQGELFCRSVTGGAGGMTPGISQACCGLTHDQLGSEDSLLNFPGAWSLDLF